MCRGSFGISAFDRDVLLSLGSITHPLPTLYAIISNHLESWLAEHDAHGQPISRHVEAEFRRYLACGVLCFGFARARCSSCGHGLLVAFSCKGRGVCPSCTGRRMAQTASHLADHVIPPVPVRQWVISVPKRLRAVLADRPQAMTSLSRIFLDEIRASTTLHGSPGRSC